MLFLKLYSLLCSKDFFLFTFLVPCLFLFKYRQSWAKITRHVWQKLKHLSEMKSKNSRHQNSMLVVLGNELPFQHWNLVLGEGIIMTCLDIFWPGLWMFIRLSLFQKILQINCNRFKQTTKTRCWSKSNTTN